MCVYITTICFITLLIDRYNDGLLPLLRQFLLNNFMGLRANFPTPCFKQFYWGLINTWRYLFFLAFRQASQPRKALGSGTVVSAVGISVCLISLTPCTLQFGGRSSTRNGGAPCRGDRVRCDQVSLHGGV
jgi:hypothetical protein